MTTLLLGPSGLDDLLFLLPAWDALHEAGRLSPDTRILLPDALHSVAPLLPGGPKPISPAPRMSDRVGTLAAAGADEAWILAEGWLPRLLAWRAEIPRRIGYGGLLSRRLLTDPVPVPSRRVLSVRHRSERFRELLEAHGVELPESWIPRVDVSEELRRAGLERLQRAHVDPSEEELVGLVPGNAHPNHRWPWQRYALLAQTLRRERSSLRFVLLAGAHDDLWPSVRVHEETARRNPLVGPDLDWAQTAGVLPHLRFVVGADGDLLQLAAACGVPTVAMFGPTAVVRRMPRGAGHRIVESPGNSLRRLDLKTVLETCRRRIDEFDG